MTEREPSSGRAADLRRQAEEKAAQRPENLEALSPEETRQTLHELRVHQIELEMQNEELRRAHAELDASRARYFDLYDLAPVGYFSLSEYNLILEANLTAADLLGVARSALAKRPLPHFILSADKDIYYRFREQLLETGEPQVCELRMLRANAAAFWARLEASAVEDGESGEPVFRAVVSDIDDMKRGEQAVRQSHYELQAIYDGTLDGIIVADPETKRFVSVNPAMCQMLGYSEEELLSMSVMEIHPPTAVRAILEQFEAMMAGRLRVAQGCPLLRKDGTEIFADIACKLLVFNGRPCGIGFYHDITERRQAEDSLRENASRLRLAHQAGRMGTFEWNIQTGVNTWSPELEAMYGLAPGAFGRTQPAWEKLVHPEDRAAAVAKVQRAFATGEAVEGEWRVVWPDGSEHWVFGRFQVFRDDAGKPLRLTGVNIDITERKWAEKALAEAKAAAEAANEAKGRFLANISHELRTPMNAILGMVDLALPKQADSTAKDFLKTARESADLLLTLLNDLLDSAKIEAGKLELELAPFSLRRVLNQTTQVLAVRASEKGLSFSCHSDIPREVPDALVGDQVRLQQVLLNLAGNAIKFTERGEVTVSVRVAEGLGIGGWGLEERKQPGTSASMPLIPNPQSPIPSVMLEFAVRDTGIGIPPSDLERIFHPFAQADGSTTRRFGGTGLGLSICSSLVRLMGGRIWGESQVGKGSTFHFTVRLSLAKEQPPEPETPKVLAAAPSALRILLVEDNPANQKLAAYILQERGHTVEIAGDGRQGLNMAQQNYYDVILRDVQMPGMDGLEATKAIRAGEDSQRHVPIIAMTAHAMQSDRERCLAAGMGDYLSKPIDGHEMIALVERLAAGATPPAPTPGQAEPASAPAARVFDPELALKRCYNKPKMVGEMMQCFFAEADGLLLQMRAALQKGDLQEVGRLGHRLKGAVVYLGAEPAREAALCVERFSTSSDGTPAEAEEAINTLEQECLTLKSVLIEHPLVGEAKQGE